MIYLKSRIFIFIIMLVMGIIYFIDYNKNNFVVSLVDLGLLLLMLSNLLNPKPLNMKLGDMNVESLLGSRGSRFILILAVFAFSAAAMLEFLKFIMR